MLSVLASIRALDHSISAASPEPSRYPIEARPRSRLQHRILLASRERGGGMADIDAR
jgi:hypothetical protein